MPLTWTIARRQPRVRYPSGLPAATPPAGLPPRSVLRPVTAPGRQPGLRSGRIWIPRLGNPGPAFHVYGNAGNGPINYTVPIATVYGLTWTSPPLTYPDTWRFGVRAFNRYGEEQNLDAAVTIILDAGGNDITLRPSPPVGLRAFALAAGSVRAEWGYPVVNRATVPTGFHVYIGTGAGAPVSYGSPAATVLFASGIANAFVCNLTGLTGGTTYQIGVRAYNAVAEEPNTSFVSVTADSAGPAPVDSLTGTAI